MRDMTRGMGGQRSQGSRPALEWPSSVGEARIPLANISAPLPNVGDMVAFEAGEMTEEETVNFFQGIIDSGVVWTLQGFYGRTAMRLIEAGLCTTEH